MRSKGLFLYLAAVAVVLIGCCLCPVSTDEVLRQLSAIETGVEGNFVAIALAFFLLSALLAYLAFPSMPLVCVAAGYSLHGLGGSMVVLVGSALGGLAAFLLYRKHIPPELREPPQKKPLNVWLSLLGLRLSPLVPAPMVTFVAAFFNASAAQVLVTALIGGAPLIVFYGLLGEQGHNYRHGAPVEKWVFPGYLALFGVSTLLSLLGPWRSFLEVIKKLKREAGVCPPEGAVVTAP